MAAAALPAHPGQPTWKKYSIEYTTAHSVEFGRMRMKPVFAGSPVAMVYRINSVLKLVCSSTATETTHNIVSP